MSSHAFIRSNSARVIAIALLILSFTSLQTYAQATKTSGITNFNQIKVSHGIDLYLTQGTSESIKITTHKDLLDKVIIEKVGTELVIRMENNTSWSRLLKNQGIKAYVSFKTLYALTASGGSDVYTQNTLKTDRFSATASGGSDLELAITTKELKVRVSGGSDADLKGIASNVDMSASGGSDIEALELNTEYAKVSATGGSDVTLSVNKAIEAGASGGSGVNFRGNAALKKTSSSSSGDVNRIK